MTSHETACLLNPSDQDAQVRITVCFSDRDPVAPCIVLYFSRMVCSGTKFARTVERNSGEMRSPRHEFVLITMERNHAWIDPLRSLGGRVWPTLEMLLTEMPVHLRRFHDEETGLALIRLAA